MLARFCTNVSFPEVRNLAQWFLGFTERSRVPAYYFCVFIFPFQVPVEAQIPTRGSLRREQNVILVEDRASLDNIMLKVELHRVVPSELT